MTDLLDLMQPGARLREQGMSLAEDAEGEVWRRTADLALTMLAEAGDPFTADDLRRLAGVPRHRCAIGALMMRAIRDQRISEVGTTHSDRPEARRRRLVVYRGQR